jgi:hypothetical protein
LGVLLRITRRLRYWQWHSQQFSAPGQVLRAVAVSKEAIMTDALETIRKNMRQEAPQEFLSG